MLRDVTLERHALRALAERERFWSQVLGAVPETLYVQDLRARKLLFSNQNLAVQLGYAADFGADDPAGSCCA